MRLKTLASVMTSGFKSDELLWPESIVNSACLTLIIDLFTNLYFINVCMCVCVCARVRAHACVHACDEEGKVSIHGYSLSVWMVLKVISMICTCVCGWVGACVRACVWWGREGIHMRLLCQFEWCSWSSLQFGTLLWKQSGIFFGVTDKLIAELTILQGKDLVAMDRNGLLVLLLGF